jgi:hypothetical protein
MDLTKTDSSFCLHRLVYFMCANAKRVTLF